MKSYHNSQKTDIGAVQYWHFFVNSLFLHSVLTFNTSWLWTIKLICPDPRPVGAGLLHFFVLFRASKINPFAMVCIPALSLLFTFIIFIYLWFTWRNFRQGQIVLRRVAGWWTNNELQRIHKEAVLTWGCIIQTFRLEGLRKYANLSKGSGCPSHMPNTSENSYMVRKCSQRFSSSISLHRIYVLILPVALNFTESIYFWQLCFLDDTSFVALIMKVYISFVELLLDFLYSYF